MNQGQGDPAADGKDVGTVVEEFMERIEKKRKYEGLPEKIVGLIAVVASLYQLFYAVLHPYFALEHRAIHWLFLSSLLFILYPFHKKISPRRRMSVVDWWWLGVTVGTCLWLFVNAEGIMQRAGKFGPSDVVLSVMMLLVALEGTRRTTGWAVTIIAAVFLCYAYFGQYLPDLIAHKGYGVVRIATYLALSTDGIFGVPIGVSANFIFLFILYGAILRKSGAGEFFTDIAFALTGGARGGPAKAAVVSSTFFGMISGSSVANTVTTGSFTIPLMKRTGYPAHFAGGVEASSSTMGQIMPPIMGAAAFIMAEFLAIPYYKVCVAAVIPATLAFYSTYMQVHFKAKLMGLVGLPKDELPGMREVMGKGWHHLFSILVLVYFLVLNYSPERAVVFAIVAELVFSSFRKHSRMGLETIYGALKEGAVDSIDVAAACAAAGIIIGTITMTGLGINMSSLVVDLSGGNLLSALPLTMVACLFLGMGVPTTAQYVIISTLVAPALVQMGVEAIAAHMFILYFGTRADITPPVALAAYAGAGIARADPWKTGLAAFQLGLAGFIIPFMFVYAPELLLIGSVFNIVVAVATALIGIYCLAASIQGCYMEKTTSYERVLLFIAAVCFIKPGVITDAVGFVLFGIVTATQWKRTRPSAPGSVERSSGSPSPDRE